MQTEDVQSGRSLRADGRTAIVTGAGQGLGRAFSLALAAEGATIIVAELNEERGRSVATEIEAARRGGPIS